MNALDTLGDPVRRRIVELLATADQAAGKVSSVVEQEFNISQPAVSRHLRVLREAGFVSASTDGARRIYRLEETALTQLEDQVNRYRQLWNQRLDALDTEIARGKSQRKEDQ